jgi:hypothetical protein
LVSEAQYHARTALRALRDVAGLFWGAPDGFGDCAEIDERLVEVIELLGHVSERKCRGEEGQRKLRLVEDPRVDRASTPRQPA